jgi:hypothetical protein
MAASTVPRKVTKGRVVRTPDGFEVGQTVHFVAVSPRTWLMTLEPVAEAQRLAAALPGAPPTPWADAMTRVRGAAHATGRRTRIAGPLERESATSDVDALSAATIVAPKRKARVARAVV